MNDDDDWGSSNGTNNPFPLYGAFHKGNVSPRHLEETKTTRTAQHDSFHWRDIDIPAATHQHGISSTGMKG